MANFVNTKCQQIAFFFAVSTFAIIEEVALVSFLKSCHRNASKMVPRYLNLTKYILLIFESLFDFWYELGKQIYRFLATKLWHTFIGTGLYVSELQCKVINPRYNKH